MELTPLSAGGDGDGMFVQCEPAVAADKTLSEFFHTVKALVRASGDLSTAEHSWGARERELAGALESTKVEVHAALCDNVDTPRTLRSLLVRCGGVTRLQLRCALCAFHAQLSRPPVAAASGAGALRERVRERARGERQGSHAAGAVCVALPGAQHAGPRLLLGQRRLQRGPGR
jgi:hypothetical protein